MELTGNKMNVPFSHDLSLCRSGSISVEDLKVMCDKLGVPININEVQNLLKE